MRYENFAPEKADPEKTKITRMAFIIGIVLSLVVILVLKILAKAFGFVFNHWIIFLVIFFGLILLRKWLKARSERLALMRAYANPYRSV